MALINHFPGQRQNERVISVIHRHWFNIATHFFVVGVIALIILVSLIVTSLLPKTLGITLDAPLFSFLLSGFLLFLWVYIFITWIDYYFDVWIITNERIINIEQKNLFIRTTSEVTLTRVQDVTATIGGFFPTLLDFGDVLVQTAGEQEHFHFRNVPNPEAYKEEIMLLVKKAVADHGHENQQF
jgi:hypothetical protein